MQSVIAPNTDPAYGSKNASAVAAASLVVKNKPCIVYQINGYNNNAAAQFIQLHDAAALPADTAVPVFAIKVPAASQFSISFGTHGRAFFLGSVVCNSSTFGTKTIGAADCSFDAQYGSR